MKEFDPLEALAVMQEALPEWLQRESRRLNRHPACAHRIGFLGHIQLSLHPRPYIPGLDPNDRGRTMIFPSSSEVPYGISLTAHKTPDQGSHDSRHDYYYAQPRPAPLARRTSSPDIFDTHQVDCVDQINSGLLIGRPHQQHCRDPAEYQ